MQVALRKLLFRPGRGWARSAGLSRAIPLRADWPGLGVGLATVGVVSLFTRNADVDIPTGTQVEMVLQRPLQLEDENLAGVGPPGAAPSFVPASTQPRPMTSRRPRIMCPPGSLGCE